MSELQAEAQRALREAFGARPVEGVAAIRAGRSGATVSTFRIDGRAYVVRVPDPKREDHEARVKREVECATMAAERGIGPEVHFADRTTGIVITTMIEDVLVGAARGLAPGRYERLAKTLRTLHEGPAIEGGGNVFAILDHFDGLLRSHRGRGVPADLDRVLRAATEAAQRFGVVAPCHNDLNPSNILETPDRAYLVDWETAGPGDPFVDVAQIGVFGTLDDDARSRLLQCYLGRPPTPSEREHAHFARVIALGFYAVGFTTIAAMTGEGDPEDIRSPRTMRELLMELGAGKAPSKEIAASLQRSAVQEFHAARP